MLSLKNNNDANRAGVEDFESIYLLYFNELYRFAFHYTMSEDAKDIVQEVFVKMYDGRDKIESNTNIRAYLYRLTKNRCIDYLKHLSVRNKHQDDIINYMLNDADYEEQNEMDAQKREKSISSLPDMQRKIIKLRLEGKSYQEISELLTITPGSVNTHINRAYKKIKKDCYVLFTILNGI